MRKFAKWIVILSLIASAFWIGTIVNDKETLQNNLIRLHVVANSDSTEDQNMKLLVRDAIVEKLNSVMPEFTDLADARKFIQDNLGELQKIANEALTRAGAQYRATVSLGNSEFPRREYDTFSLPAGVYESLKVIIGDGEGKNWWCVVFPSLCISATSEGTEDAAVSAGFSNRLSGTLTGRPQYRIRFFIMDCLGWIENRFYR